ncbi:hypothetical protein JHN63_24145 [Streptomyces sp. MBT65]|uniref:hypothetical protein n=1 Tax=Streptomyces sp. MBT65 TaxID=1488395 RepID=UPI00190A37F3|nr:hypothetical protein [Streptomyces sp. MBT65]MBK3576842.1 hypothetical protein [Streptomyces sp. MBT65]
MERHRQARRYADKPATDCDGLIPYKESAVFTSLDIDAGWSRDLHDGFDDERFDTCQVADLLVTVGLVAKDVVGSESSFDILDMLHTQSADTLPVALGGGWYGYGYTDRRNTAVVLPCADRPVSLVVSTVDDGSHRDSDTEVHAVAVLAAATARKAAERRSCEAEFGGRIVALATETEHASAETATGMCRGVGVSEGAGGVSADEGGASADEDIVWAEETEASGSTPLEGCLLGGDCYAERPGGPWARGDGSRCRPRPGSAVDQPSAGVCSAGRCGRRRRCG